MSKKTLAVRVSVIIENPLGAMYKNMIAGEAWGWFQPNRFPIPGVVSLKESVGQDVASATSEEDPIRQSPSLRLIALSIAGCADPIHTCNLPPLRASVAFGMQTRREAP